MRLRAGTLVEVRPAPEILATLDADGTLDGLPFMPEMLEYCGRRLLVHRVAHKTCDTITKTGGRRMRDAVHLEGIRCDGSAHGGCQAACLIFWKSAWLRRVDGTPAEGLEVSAHPPDEVLRRLPVTRDGESGDAEPRYVCQATELLRATTALRWWDPRQYVRDLTSGNASVWEFVRVIAIAAFNVLQRKRGGRTYPFTPAPTARRTPPTRLDLAPGELVRIKPSEEIAATLDTEIGRAHV